jgi:quinoprotein glucose dehydrogenase
VLDELTRDNIGRLEPAWTFHTGDVSDGSGEVRSGSAFEGTPILVDGLLIFCSPFDRVFALEPASGSRPYVVIAAGGHARMGSRLGDALVAFSLPD